MAKKVEAGESINDQSETKRGTQFWGSLYLGMTQASVTALLCMTIYTEEKTGGYITESLYGVFVLLFVIGAIGSLWAIGWNVTELILFIMPFSVISAIQVCHDFPRGSFGWTVITIIAQLLTVICAWLISTKVKTSS
ncbi:MAG: hypothetical protein E6Y04_11415 [Corynebacterium sp.]|uniref:hypothetical protein n=1 Tax=Corynebacterium sp. TaxID=1720 RepID=UPI00290775E6|nr:hypothetical protein [Corynebacterium sp.]MDU4730561.1 hypothetical protein [Corynebacterium sp.]